MEIFGECKTCKILQEALEFERERNKELTETLTSLIKPAPVINEIRQVSANLKPIGLTFTKRRAELEKADRIRQEAEKSPHAARSDKELITNKRNTVEELEKQLGVSIIESEKSVG